MYVILSKYIFSHNILLADRRAIVTDFGGKFPGNLNFEESMCTRRSLDFLHPFVPCLRQEANLLTISESRFILNTQSLTKQPGVSLFIYFPLYRLCDFVNEGTHSDCKEREGMGGARPVLANPCNGHAIEMQGSNANLGEVPRHFYSSPVGTN